MNKLFLLYDEYIGKSLQPGSFIMRRQRQGKPIRNSRGDYRLFRALDVVAAARADLLTVIPKEEDLLASSIEELREINKSLREEKELLQQQNEKIRSGCKIMKFGKLNKGLSNVRMFSEEEIVEQSHVSTSQCGVYFLVRRNEIVYVGQSVSVPSRVAQHAKDGKKFDSFAYVICDREQLDIVESLYIHALRPELNGTSVNGKKLAPFNYEEIVRQGTTRFASATR